MDMVRGTTIVTISLCAALPLLWNVRPSRAATADTAARTEASPPRDAHGIGHAFPIADRAPIFTLSGVAFPAQAGAGPSIYETSLLSRSRFNRSPDSAEAARLPAGGMWDPLVEEASRRFMIPTGWVRGVLQVESGGRATVDGRPITSAAGAMGLMQIMPATFAELSRRYGFGSDPYEPRANILAGTAYLREMYDRFGPSYFLAAYNAGPGRVEDYLRYGSSLPLETQRYVRTLAPRLVGSCGDDIWASPSVVRDLTSAETIRDAARSSSRPHPEARRSFETATLFVSSSNHSSTPGRRTAVQFGDRLFVQLPHLARQRGSTQDDVPQD